MRLFEVLFAAAAAVAGVAAFREAAWRRTARRELSDESAWGALAPGDVAVLASWKRFRSGWLAGRRERAAFRRIARRLARAKAAQRQAPPQRRRLLQVEILTLRTRLRRAAPAAASSRETGD